jgi:hypothetical protein
VDFDYVLALINGVEANASFPSGSLVKRVVGSNLTGS